MVDNFISNVKVTDEIYDCYITRRDEIKKEMEKRFSLLDKIKDVIKDYFLLNEIDINEAQAYLFGSSVKGYSKIKNKDLTEDSDIDIMVDCKDFITLNQIPIGTIENYKINLVSKKRHYLIPGACLPYKFPHPYLELNLGISLKLEFNHNL